MSMGGPGPFSVKETVIVVKPQGFTLQSIGPDALSNGKYIAHHNFHC